MTHTSHTLTKCVNLKGCYVYLSNYYKQLVDDRRFKQGEGRRKGGVNQVTEDIRVLIKSVNPK